MSTHIPALYSGQSALIADLYHLTMAYGFWKTDRSERQAVFHLFYRTPPFQQGYVVAAGLELVMDYLQGFHFDHEDIRYLGQLTGSDNKPLFDIGFLNYLQRMEFSCDLDAVPEGTPIFPHQPVLRVQGPLAQATLIESALLNLINFSSLIATKASRIVEAAQGDPVLEFGLRRAQGLDGALTASRAAYIGGCHATSNLLAGKWYNIPVKGTHAHSWVMCFDTEMEAFTAYANSLPNNCILLVDTYDTIEGVKKAIRIGKSLEQRGYTLHGIRLDSGDLVVLAKEARHLLDEAGLKATSIVGSDSLDEQQIRKLKEHGAPIDTWGVGTRLVTGQHEPALGGVYKLGALQRPNGTWEPKMKLSEEAIKTSNPGILDVRRYLNTKNIPVADAIHDTLSDDSNELIPFGREPQHLTLNDYSSRTLLRPVLRQGQAVYHLPSLPDIRTFSLEQQKLFSHIDPHLYPNGLESNLYQHKQNLIQKIRPGHGLL